MKKKVNPAKFKIGNQIILKGERKRVKLEIASLYDYTKINIPIEVIRGLEDGPIMFISAAIHGDEINGTEIIKRISQRIKKKSLKGTLILIPVVNLFGFYNKSRYLPDRKDLNRCFPGTRNGSLGSQIANVFMKEIVSKCTHGIDLHTGAIHRTNLPQIRACIDDHQTKKMALSFGAPVIINSKLRDGSLREAARKKKVNFLLFEGGEALRFQDKIVKAGLNGCLSVMKDIGMLKTFESKTVKNLPFIAQSSYWVRAPHSGSFRILKKPGEHVEAKELLAVVSDPFGENPYNVYSKEAGVIVGLSEIPLVNKGDAMIHIATSHGNAKTKLKNNIVDVI